MNGIEIAQRAKAGVNSNLLPVSGRLFDFIKREIPAKYQYGLFSLFEDGIDNLCLPFPGFSNECVVLNGADLQSIGMKSETGW